MLIHGSQHPSPSRTILSDHILMIFFTKNYVKIRLKVTKDEITRHYDGEAEEIRTGEKEESTKRSQQNQSKD